MDEQFTMRVNNVYGNRPATEALTLSVVVTQVGLWSYELSIRHDFGDDDVMKMFALAKAADQWQERHPEIPHITMELKDGKDHVSHLLLVVD